MVTFHCHPNYKLHGYKTNSCVSGHWSRDLPVCVGEHIQERVQLNLLSVDVLRG